MKRSLTVASIGFLCALTIVGCASTTPDPSAPTQTIPSSPTPTIPDNLPVTDALEFTTVSVGGPKILVPTEWSDAVVPGADKGFLVTTAPGGQTVGITVLSRTPTTVTAALLAETAATLQTAVGGGGTVGTEVTSVSLGMIQVSTPSTSITGWVLSTATTTFLITLGPAYTVTTGTPKPVPVPTAFAPGTVDEQVRAMLNRNLTP